MRGASRRALDVDASTQLVTESFLPGGGTMPLVVEPAVPGVDLAAWASANRSTLEQRVTAHGAVLFRGFGLTTPADFEAVASGICPDLFGDYGDLPREGESHRIYQSTPYPNDMTILYHNESSHLPTWPLRQFFFSEVVATEGGETPILDCRAVLDLIDPAIVERFETKGVTYVRNFVPGVDVAWQDFFKTDDPRAVERVCIDSGMECEWTGADRLRVKNRTEAVRTHPVTGERIFFNQIQLHHVRCLPDAVRSALVDVIGEDDMPRSVTYGDGSPISDDEMDHIGEVFDRTAVKFPWQVGDLIMIDNMLVAHARLPFSGPRKIVVAMARMTNGSGPLVASTAS